jgi:cation:H+ antiporter
MMILGIFLFLSLVILVVGIYLTNIADRLADKTGLGEALMGGMLLGACTSLSGTVTSVTAATHGHTDLAISNALGGIALQTFFLVIADFLYRKSNLEHAAASSTNILQGLLLIFLLALPLLSFAFNDFTLLGVHPISLIIVISYIGGLHFVNDEKGEKMWFPRTTKLTVEDIPQEKKDSRGAQALWQKFLVMTLILGICGYYLELYGIRLSKKFDIDQFLLGALFTALVTSLPELVTTITAVRRNAITLAVGGIIGGNTFDVLFLVFSDIAYKESSLYHQFTPQHFGLIGLNLLMTSVLVFGLIRRERSGFANIGFETVVMGLIFLFGFSLIL